METETAPSSSSQLEYPELWLQIVVAGLIADDFCAFVKVGAMENLDFMHVKCVHLLPSYGALIDMGTTNLSNTCPNKLSPVQICIAY